MNMRKGQQEALGVGFDNVDGDDVSLSSVRVMQPCLAGVYDESEGWMISKMTVIGKEDEKRPE